MHSIRSVAALAVASVLTSVPARAAVDDHMVPPTGKAAEHIAIDGRGFTIDGARTYLASGSIHYARVPHELWHDRLLRLSRADFNCVQTYAFWNFHEPHQGQVDFTGDRDFGAFLTEAQRVGLYATVRPGPYVCAEWDMGGYPIWLRFKPPMKLRTDDPAYLAASDHWYDLILPIVAKHQIQNGGNVVLVQLENEHPKGWGVPKGSPYFDHLEAEAKRFGIDVPHFMSGLHHGAAPRPEGNDMVGRTTPWYTTEFWSGWFDLYGNLGRKKFTQVTDANWLIMARGGAGQNYYMFHGGSNFDTWNDPSGAASYDYGAAVGQAGDLRPIYFEMKRANQLAASFADVLADGSDVASEYADAATGVKLIGARRSPAGTVLFLHNPTAGTATVTLADGTAMSVAGNESFALPRDVRVAEGLKIATASARVLAVAHDGDVTTVVVYGTAGEHGTITFDTARPMHQVNATAGVAISGSKVSVTYPAGGPEWCLLTDGTHGLRVVAVSGDLSLYTWIVGGKGHQQVVVGPEYVADDEAGHMLVERPYGKPACGRVMVFGSAEAPSNLAVDGNPALDAAPAPALSGWQMATAPQATTGFDDKAWMSSSDPQQMGADGDTSAFAWYRSSVTAPAAGHGVLHLHGSDELCVYVNGHLAPDVHHGRRGQWDVGVDLVAGRNALAVFTSHAGRDKMYNYLGPLNHKDDKGLYGPVTVTVDGHDAPVTGWRMRGGVDPQAAGLAWSAPADTRGLPSLFKATFNAEPYGDVGAHPIYRFSTAGLSRGTAWLNGHNLGRYPEKIRVDGMYLPECWMRGGANELVVFDETGRRADAGKLVVEVAASREVIRVDRPCDPATPMVFPARDAAVDLAKANAGNLAWRAHVTASSSEDANPPEAATDGDPDTRWCATGPRPGEWLKVDLGSPKDVGQCEIVWERPAIEYRYKLDGSVDGTTWVSLGDDTTAVAQSPDSPSPLSHLNFASRPLRYVRVTTVAADQKRWASLFELRLFKGQ
jgi:beta-galactosidase